MRPPGDRLVERSFDCILDLDALYVRRRIPDVYTDFEELLSILSFVYGLGAYGEANGAAHVYA